MTDTLTFDAVAEAKPGAKWQARWQRCWPAYEAWFVSRGGDNGPDRAECEAALERYMPELVPVHRQLTRLAGGGDRAARFLSTWCPPTYLGGCSVAAVVQDETVRLVRNYDLSPDLNEGLLLRSEWTGQPVMGMIEFLWGISDGVNAAGLALAVAYGGRSETGRGFGVTTILRYVLETCGTVSEALAALRRVPSHMAYNVVLADRDGVTASVELAPGGGMRVLHPAVATNHQHGVERAERPGFTRTGERRQRLEQLIASQAAPGDVGDAFLRAPLFQRNYTQGFGTLFTAVYDPVAGGLTLRWPDQTWRQRLDAFDEGSRTISYAAPVATAAASFDIGQLAAAIGPYVRCPEAVDAWVADSRRGTTDWARFGALFAGAGNCTAH